jgi:hypothetical protein
MRLIDDTWQLDGSWVCLLLRSSVFCPKVRKLIGGQKAKDAGKTRYLTVNSIMETLICLHIGKEILKLIYMVHFRSSAHCMFSF